MRKYIAFISGVVKDIIRSFFNDYAFKRDIVVFLTITSKDTKKLAVKSAQTNYFRCNSHATEMNLKTAGTTISNSKVLISKDLVYRMISPLLLQ